MIPVKHDTVQEISPEEVRWFGTEIKRTYKKDGDFKSFDSHTWIQTHKGDKYYTDTSIGKLKKRFDNFHSDKKVIKELKSGTWKKAIEWNCEVTKDKGKKIRSDQMEMVLDAMNNHKPFTLDGKHMYFYINGVVFKDSKNGTIVYVDTDKNMLIDVNIEGKPTTEKINEWIENYKQTN